MGYLGWWYLSWKHPCICLWSCHRNHHCVRASINSEPQIRAGRMHWQSKRRSVVCAVVRVWTSSEHNVDYFTALPGLYSNPGRIVFLRVLEGDRPLAATSVSLPTLTPLVFPEATKACNNSTPAKPLVMRDPKSWSCIGSTGLINKLFPQEHRMNQINQDAESLAN